MRLVIEYNGVTYEGAEEPGDAAKFAEKLYGNLAHVKSLKIDLASGGFLLLGPIAVKTAIFKVLP
jgi:hypothetical protein